MRRPFGMPAHCPDPRWAVRSQALTFRVLNTTCSNTSMRFLGQDEASTRCEHLYLGTVASKDEFDAFGHLGALGSAHSQCARASGCTSRNQWPELFGLPGDTVR